MRRMVAFGKAFLVIARSVSDEAIQSWLLASELLRFACNDD